MINDILIISFLFVYNNYLILWCVVFPSICCSFFFSHFQLSGLVAIGDIFSFTCMLFFLSHCMLYFSSMVPSIQPYRLPYYKDLFSPGVFKVVVTAFVVFFKIKMYIIFLCIDAQDFFENRISYCPNIDYCMVILSYLLIITLK